MENILYPNNSRYVLGAERERYAKIAAERYAAGASIQAIADELGRSRSFVNGLLHRDTDVEVRPRSVSRRPASGA
ncbi:helix-turn-helix domain-containing protein [Streptomyces sp. NPDC001663]|uniref:helix-turn-helix domain-containing protein n=1 Tax=Streptomyces sp. NPDC001663 TaxID=3364597 RepID=UPI00368BB020